MKLGRYLSSPDIASEKLVMAGRDPASVVCDSEFLVKGDRSLPSGCWVLERLVKVG